MARKPRSRTVNEEGTVEDSGVAGTEWEDIDPIVSYTYDEEDGEILRSVRTRSGRTVWSSVPVPDGDSPIDREDLGAAHDRAWLRAEKWPSCSSEKRSIRLVDLFSGCGGMTLGVAEACRSLDLSLNPVLAVDVDDDALSVYHDNFAATALEDTPVEDLFEGEPGDALTEKEKKIRNTYSPVDVLVAGPPCQGSSDLNNHTRRDDPKNELYFTIVRAVEVLRPKHVIVENVIGIQHDRREVFQRTKESLGTVSTTNDYSVDSSLLKAEDFGVAQRRHRLFLAASSEREIDLEEYCAQFRVDDRDFAWACGDLKGRVADGGGFDRTTSVAPKTQERIDTLFENEAYNLPDDLRPPCHEDTDYDYKAIYGRMWEDRPAPTITTGFTSMGQGRFVHPTERRMITPHEAARLQFLPDFFHFGDRTRNTYKTLIGNAVPPKLTFVISLQMLR